LDVDISHSELFGSFLDISDSELFVYESFVLHFLASLNFLAVLNIWFC